MSEFKIKGTLQTILAVESGVAKSSGKEWKKLNFTVTNNDGYEGKEMLYCFQIFGEEKVDTFKKYNQEGSEVEVKFSVQTNEYNGKYFTNLSAFHVASGERVEQASQTPAPEEEDESNLPF
jgi:hypothetical protein